MASVAALRAEILVGPLLRYAGTESATVWVETSRACEVEVLGHREQTFQIEGHHYALVLIDDLEPSSETPYEVRLDGRLAWPPADGRPAPVIRTRNGERRLRLAFGSCRVGAPQPQSAPSPWKEELRRTGVDALWAYARELQEGRRAWPDALMLLGDQVYADEVSPETAAYIDARRHVGHPPGEEVADFEEFTHLYREAWSDPDIRWLLSTVPSMMIFDDHDVIDDWNISESWVEEIRRRPWWDARITGAFMAYWVYQHLGNLSPPALAEEQMLRRARELHDVGPELRAFARMCDRETASCRWAYDRDFGDSRVLVLDSRAARVLAGGRRDMIDDEEWDWIVERTRGDFDHLVLSSTLPVFMSHGVHRLEAWNEAICSGAWGAGVARFGEWLRREVDLEHWPAFQSSFRKLVDLLRATADGDRSHGHPPPASIVLLGGDVHNAYVAEIDLGLEEESSRVHQVVCSPFRNPLPPRERRIVRVTGSRATALVFGVLARLAGVEPPGADWRYLQRPTFHNAIGELELEGATSRVTIRRAAVEGEDPSVLVDLHVTELAAGRPRDTEPQREMSHAASR
jgi:hypothetical protein